MKRATAAAVEGAADGSALAIFAVSLRKMANFYSTQYRWLSAMLLALPSMRPKASNG